MKDTSGVGEPTNPYPEILEELTQLRGVYDHMCKVYPVARTEFVKAVNNARASIDTQHKSSGGGAPPPDHKLLDEAPSAPVVERKDVKKIFRKIAKETHPDAILDDGMSAEEQQKRVEMFQTARKASEEQDWYSLFKIADDLGIQLANNSVEYRNILKLAIKSVRSNIMAIYNDPAWVWYHCHPSKKRQIINHFIKSGI